MSILIINPGTHGDKTATLANAEVIAAEMSKAFYLPVVRDAARDSPPDGYFGFRVEQIELDIPGDDPDVFFESRPFHSRRMYVNGSSWLWKYGLGIVLSKLEGAS